MNINMPTLQQRAESIKFRQFQTCKQGHYNIPDTTLPLSLYSYKFYNLSLSLIYSVILHMLIWYKTTVNKN